MYKHKNDGQCLKCLSIIQRYSGFHFGLFKWFQALQLKHPEAHISCAGRGRQDQEEVFHRGASRARFGESAHNYNAALDLFKNQGNDLYDRSWFQLVVAPAIRGTDFEWYGSPGAAFPELPHVQVKAWRALADNDQLTKVEE
ncbi:MAG: hypothetical protein WC130_05000 [Kiritimatiellia bacterium]